MITVEKINDVKVRPVKLDNEDDRPILGADWFARTNINVSLIAKKNSGKTTIIWNILKHCASKRTSVIIFCSTIHKDNTYKQIISMLEKKGCPVSCFESFIDENNHNILQELVDEWKKADVKEEEEEEVVKEIPIVKFTKDEEEEAREIKPRKSKYLSPEYFVICDDLSTLLQNPVVSTLSKMNRHFKLNFICSFHYDTDVRPSYWKQQDYILIFKSLAPEKLKKIYELIDLSSVTFPEFLDLYNFATKEKYSFLYIDTRDESFRRNFSEKIIIK